MACGRNVSRCLLISVNLLFLLAGIVLIALGTMVKLNKFSSVEDANFDGSGLTADQQADLKQWVKLAPLALIVFGCFVFLTAFVGCYGASKQSRVMLGLYFVIVAMILISEIVLGSFVVANRNNVTDYATKLVNGTWAQNKQIFQSICDSTAHNGTAAADDDPGQTLCAAPTQECFDCVAKPFKNNLDIAGAVLLGLCALEILCMVTACCLFVSSKHLEEKQHLVEGGYRNYQTY